MTTTLDLLTKLNYLLLSLDIDPAMLAIISKRMTEIQDTLTTPITIIAPPIPVSPIIPPAPLTLVPSNIIFFCVEGKYNKKCKICKKMCDKGTPQFYKKDPWEYWHFTCATPSDLEEQNFRIFTSNKDQAAKLQQYMANLPEETKKVS